MSYDSIHNPIIGIDLGTTFSSVSRWDGAKADVYCPKGEYFLPSVIYYEEGKIMVGTVATLRGSMKPENLCIGVKRLMNDGASEILLDEKTFTPIELSSSILKSLYENVKLMFPENKFEAQGVVLTVPYYFRANEISNTEQAGKDAGLNIIGIIQEPIAAALYYALHLSGNSIRDENILIFDLGGGTFDLTLFNLKEDLHTMSLKTLCTGGDDRLGGLDFDKKLYDYIVKREKIDFESCTDIKQRKTSEHKLMIQIIAAKERLGFDDIAYIQALDVPPGGFVDCTVTVEEFNESIKEYTDKIKKVITQMLKSAQISKTQVHKVIKIGGSSKITIVDKIIDEVLGEGKIYGDVDPLLSVTKGAAIYGAYLKDVLGLKKKLEIKLINSHALGVKDSSDNFIELIPKDVEIPFEETLVFTNAKDNDTEFDIEIYQGEDEKCVNNKKIGSVHINNLVKRPKETLDIPITFIINKDQTVKVKVVQKESDINIEKVF